MNKKAKDDHAKPNEEEGNEVVENNDNDRNDDDDDNFHEDDLDSEPDVVESDLVVGSKERNARSKKTTNSNLICDADDTFQLMHGPGDFSSLSCNDFNNKLTVADMKALNKKKLEKNVINFILVTGRHFSCFSARQ